MSQVTLATEADATAPSGVIRSDQSRLHTFSSIRGAARPVTLNSARPCVHSRVLTKSAASIASRPSTASATAPAVPSTIHSPGLDPSTRAPPAAVLEEPNDAPSRAATASGDPEARTSHLVVALMSVSRRSPESAVS